MASIFLHIIFLPLEIPLLSTHVFQVAFMFITLGYFFSVFFLLFPTSNNDLFVLYLNSFQSIVFHVVVSSFISLKMVNSCRLIFFLFHVRNLF